MGLTMKKCINRKLLNRTQCLYNQNLFTEIANFGEVRNKNIYEFNKNFYVILIDRHQYPTSNFSLS